MSYERPIASVHERCRFQLTLALERVISTTCPDCSTFAETMGRKADLVEARKTLDFRRQLAILNSSLLLGAMEASPLEVLNYEKKHWPEICF